MGTVEQEQVASRELALPSSVQEALGELVNAAKDGRLALSVGVGLGVLSEMMEAEVDEVVARRASAMPTGPRCATATRPARSPWAGAVLASAGRGRGPSMARTRWGWRRIALRKFRDPLTRVVLEQMLAGVSTRRFARTREPVGREVVNAERSTSRSAVSREFVGRTGEHLRALMSRPLGDIRLAALMLDGIELRAAAASCAWA